MLVLPKYGIRVCVILFGFYSTHYKVYIQLRCINKQQQTAPFDNTYIISSSNRQTQKLYQGSEDWCEGESNYNIICFRQPSQTIHYFNQSVLVIVPDVNIFVLVLRCLISFREAPWYSFYYYVLAICKL